MPAVFPAMLKMPPVTPSNSFGDVSAMTAQPREATPLPKKAAVMMAMTARRLDEPGEVERRQDPKTAEDIKDRGPAEAVDEPSHERREGNEREILRSVEDGGSGAALGAGEPRRDDPRIGREVGGFGD